MKKFPQFIFLLYYSCASAKLAVSQETSEKKTENSVIDTLKTNYPPYNFLKGQFVLKGKAENQELFYDGVLEIRQESFYVVLKDTVFRSPFFSLKIDKDKVTQVDHLQNKKEIIPLSEYRWVVLFGKVFPFRFFYPILRGYPPDEIFQSDVVYEEKGKDKGIFSFKTVYFDARLVVEGGYIRNLFYKSETNGEIVAITFEGEVEKEPKKKYRYFPKKIYISRPKSTDYVQLEFSHIQVE